MMLRSVLYDRPPTVTAIAPAEDYSWIIFRVEKLGLGLDANPSKDCRTSHNRFTVPVFLNASCDLSNLMA